MSKVVYLFDPSKFESRKTAEQEEFDELHKEDLPIFHELTLKAFQMTKAESRRKQQHFKNKNYNAILMSGNLAGLLRERFPTEVRDGANDRLMFCRNGQFCIYFKKLDNRKMPSNVRTVYAQLVAYQKQIPGGDQMPIVFVGYTVDEEWSQITGTYAVYIQENRRIWITAIHGKDDSDAMIVPVIAPPPPNPIKPNAKRVRKKAE